MIPAVLLRKHIGKNHKHWQKNNFFGLRYTQMDRPVSLVVKDIAIGTVCLRFDSRAGQSGAVLPTARHRSLVSSELCWPGAKSQR